jgi:hypothetical protein
MAQNDNVRNIGRLSAEELMRLFENGVLLEYGGIAIKIEAVMLATAQHYVDDYRRKSGTRSAQAFRRLWKR